MMDLQKRLIELSSYKAGCKFVDNFFLINITYKEGWSVIEPENELIEHGEREGVYYYVAPMDSVTVDEVFDNINDTIVHNLDIEAKCELLEKKVEELQAIFAEENIETLKTIKFTYTKKEKRVKTNSSTKTKTNKSTKSKKKVKTTKKQSKGIEVQKEEVVAHIEEDRRVEGYFLEDETDGFKNDVFDQEEEVAIPVNPNGENKYLEIVER